ncbi:PREDICTED: rab proteins geranylgeranyltransferase component A [Nicrophorus vespilloides]|uniref:Rab proteins geranylgeranyltransferase component A n=1 Tax=Nicrophorus vespilloides TaxID=110193 RepID=A0ABM1NAH0_NICVS|nr:PREDICTED: rab proteins geranylgeranyltransferase component A [Nicrophorus vespilloides]
MDTLPTEFDLIVVGTGLIESAVSAAASRIGKRVLHIDSKDYYGGLWASFNLENIETVFSKPQSNIHNAGSEDVQLDANQKKLVIGNDLFEIIDIEQAWHVLEKDKDYDSSLLKTKDVAEAALEVSEECNAESVDAVTKEVPVAVEANAESLVDEIQAIAVQEAIEKNNDVDIQEGAVAVIEAKENAEKETDPVLEVKEEFNATNDIHVEAEEAQIVEEEHLNNVTSLEVSAAAVFKPWSQESIMKQSRKFNLDLTPKVQFSRGEFVKLLVSSNIARYAEYIAIGRILTYLDGKLIPVPCSRSNIFSSPHVNVIEKRVLMKLLSTLMDSTDKDFSEYDGKTFKEYLQDRKLSPELIHYIVYSIALSDDETSCSDGVKNVKRFLASLGIIGQTPFIYSMYGSGEIPQAFCRLSAVFGGTYALNQPLSHFIYDEEHNFKGLISGQQKITASNLVTGFEYAPNEMVEKKEMSYISRGIFITDKSVLEADKQKTSLILMPSKDGKTLCHIIEAGHWSGVCPKDLYIVHMSARRTASAKEDLKYYVDTLFSNDPNDTKPNVLWSFYFAIPDTNDKDYTQHNSKNSFFCPGPDSDLDYDNSIQKASKIFDEIYPDSEFLPRAPDPDEIIFCDDSDEAAEEVKEAGAGDLPQEIEKTEEKQDSAEISLN